MTQATDLLGARSASDIRIVSVVSAAHFVSHYYILVLPPLFAFVRADYGVSYTELGFALAAFNIVSAVVQPPAGFLVDRLGARIPLIGGLLLGAIAFATAGLIDSFWVLVAMFGLAGLGNTVYHPADYAMLSQHVAADRIGKAFSIHTFAGMLGSALAPATLLLMENIWGWRGALVGAGMLGAVVAAALVLTPDVPVAANKPRAPETGKSSRQLLLSAPVLLNLVFFALLALMSGGLQNYSVVALAALHDMPFAVANTALSAQLLLSAIGVLLGGILVTRYPRHTVVTTVSLLMMATLCVLIAYVDLRTVGIIAVMTVMGLFYGVMMPARDMIVHDITPAGSFGRVFGFVTTGFNIGGIVSPLIFGALMDHGSPALVFLLTAAFCLLSVATVLATPGRRD